LPYTRRRSAWLEGVGWLTLNRTLDEPRDSFLLSATDQAGALIWKFDLAATGYIVNHFNFHASRLVGRYFYVIAAEGPNSKCVPAPRYSEPIPTMFHLLTVELERGTVVQDFRLSDHPVIQCQIEDADDIAVLISIERQELKYYRRLTSA
jgi:hypothetical protein